MNLKVNNKKMMKKNKQESKSKKAGTEKSQNGT